MRGGAPGVETADRIGDCQVQRAGCLIPAVLVAKKGRHEVKQQPACLVSFAALSQTLRGTVYRMGSTAYRHALGGYSRYLCSYVLETASAPVLARTVQYSTVSAVGYSTSCGTQILQPCPWKLRRAIRMSEDLAGHGWGRV